MGRRVARISLLALALASCAPAAASAATTLGTTSVPTSPPCSNTLQTWVQKSTPSGSYAAPGAGVITSWSHQSASSPADTMRLRVVRPTSTPGTYTTVGLSDPQPLLANQLNTFPTRIPVAAGDLIGFTAVASNPSYDCVTMTSNGSVNIFRNDSPAAGSTDAFSTAGIDSTVAISAKLEPDADGDGFGDETQDACPTDATTQGPCPIASDTTPPDTTITKSPSAKTKKKRATFTFDATEAGATFECAFDGTGFTPCTAPVLKNVGRGRHVFQVRAIDAAGNVDATPARAEWRVVKNKKHKGKGGGK